MSNKKLNSLISQLKVICSDLTSWASDLETLDDDDLNLISLPSMAEYVRDQVGAIEAAIKEAKD